MSCCLWKLSEKEGYNQHQVNDLDCNDGDETGGDHDDHAVASSVDAFFVELENFETKPATIFINNATDERTAF